MLTEENYLEIYVQFFKESLAAHIYINTAVVIIFVGAELTKIYQEYQRQKYLKSLKDITPFEILEYRELAGHDVHQPYPFKETFIKFFHRFCELSVFIEHALQHELIFRALHFSWRFGYNNFCSQVNNLADATCKWLMIDLLGFETSLELDEKLGAVVLAMIVSRVIHLAYQFLKRWDREVRFFYNFLYNMEECLFHYGRGRVFMAVNAIHNLNLNPWYNRMIEYSSFYLFHQLVCWIITLGGSRTTTLL